MSMEAWHLCRWALSPPRRHDEQRQRGALDTGGCHDPSSQLRAGWHWRRSPMLHVRVVSPAALTGRLADRLTAAPGVQNLVVHPSAATRPDGDAIQFDVHDGVANP